MKKLIKYSTIAALIACNFNVFAAAITATPTWSYWDTQDLVGAPEYGRTLTNTNGTFTTQGNCGAVRLTSVSAGASGNLLDQNYDATKCMGYVGNEGPYHYDVNIGYFEDGLLNGEVGKVQGKDSRFFDGLEFISPDELQALGPTGDLAKNDPGWIQLVNFTNNLANPVYKTAGEGAKKINISELLNFTMTCSSGTMTGCSAGTWTLNTFDTIIDEVKELLGEATFDHLALVLKAGNDFAVYDFNFNEIFKNEFLAHGNNFSLNQNYNLSGTWNTNDLGSHAISHMSVAARDPQDTARVSTPAALSLFGLGLALLAFRRKIIQ